MARNINPQCKQCRRAGEKLFLKGDRCFSPKCAMVKRNYPPGIHGNKMRRRLTDYGLHLKEKQKMKQIYGILEKQMRKYFSSAFKSEEQTGNKLIQILETRLDNVIFRLGLASSRKQARQMVSHGLFKVNNKKVNIPSYSVKKNDLITIKKENNLILGKAEKENPSIPSWLDWDIKEKKGKILDIPHAKDIETGIDTRLIVEFYSK
jgi:small subunit ribosomal protein S4